MNEPTKHDIIKAFKEKQEKFVYYLMALNVSAIGFTLSKTYDIKYLHWNHIMLLIAILSWIISIMYAFRWVQIQFKAMRYDIHQYDINAGVLNDWFKGGTPPEGYKEDLLEQLESKMRAKVIRAEKDYVCMLFLFILGIVCFIIWRLMEILEIF